MEMNTIIAIYLYFAGILLSLVLAGAIKNRDPVKTFLTIFWPIAVLDTVACGLMRNFVRRR